MISTHTCLSWSLLSALALSLCSCRGIPGVVPLTKNQPAATKASIEQASPSSAAPVVSGATIRLRANADAIVRLPASADDTGRQAAPATQAALPTPIPPSSVQQVAWHQPPALPPYAYSGQPMPYLAAPPPAWSHAAHGFGGGCPHCSPDGDGEFHFSGYAEAPQMQCAPDGLACPWPADEYICDGGDHNLDANVKKDWTVVGLDQEDTVAHYDTLDGKTEITESNKVCIYAPRFAAVRKVVSPILHEGHERMADIAKADKLNLHEEKRLATTAVQPEQVQAELMIDQALSFRERNRGIGLDATQQLYLARHGFLPFEDLQAIQRGVFEAGEKARLAERTQAAIVWQENQAVQVVIDGKPCVEAIGTSKPEETYTYELEGKPRLRIVKIADKSDARPGEIVNFTLRFDNVGDQPVGNVTIVDNLTTRLEYVEGSQTSTRKADFKVQENEGESLVLRWEIADPLKVNEGGILRFQCRVR